MQYQTKIRVLAALIIPALIITSIYAGTNKGTTGAEFLKIGVGARAAGLGEAYVSLAKDVNALYWNPAGLAFIDTSEAGFEYNKWFEDINHSFMGLASKEIGNIGHFGAGVVYLTMDKFAGYDVNDIETGDIEAYDMAGIIGYGKKVMIMDKEVGLGLNLKYIEQKIDDKKADAIAFDAGLLADVHNNVTAGLSIQNMGNKVKFVQEQDNLPLLVRVGLSYEMKDYLIFTGELDIDKEEEEQELALGIEYNMNELIYVRGGYKDRELGNGLNFGIGLKVKDMMINYAIADYDILDYVHRLSIHMRFGKEES
ncbi:PorV/PorQ family protein [bacterium]